MLAIGMLSDALYFHRFSDFILRGENDSNTLSVNAKKEENGEKIKSLRFQKYPNCVGEA